MPLRRRSGGGGLNVQRVELNYQGVHDLLHSPGIRQDLRRRADAVAAAASSNPAVTRDRATVVVDETPQGQGSRPRVYVKLDHPAGRGIEARHRVLGSAVDAARD